MREIDRGVTKYDIMPIPPIEAQSERFEIGPISIWVEYRLLDDAIAQYRVSEGDVSLDFGRELGTTGEFRVGVYRGAGNARLKAGDPALPNIDFDTGGAFARLRFDSLDNSRFPRKGRLANLHLNLSRPEMGADNEFDTVEGEFSQTWSRGKSSLQFALAYATTLSSDNTVQDFFRMGGFLRLSGLERGEISGPHSALARLSVWVPL